MKGRVIAATAATAVVVGVGSGWLATDAHAAPIGTSPIAAVAGTDHVGRIDLELADSARARRIMVSAWYPTVVAGVTAPYLPTTDLLQQARIAALSAVWLHAPNAAANIVGRTVAAAEDAPVDPAAGQLPVVIVSPGIGTPRWLETGLASDLASRGYAVITIDHTGESPAVAFPDGSVVLGEPVTMTDSYLSQQLATRVADTQLVLDQLPQLPGIGARLDFTRIAMAGHSYGGLTTVQTMAIDPRISAGVVLDGSAGWDHVAAAPSLDRPVLLLGSGDTLHPSWAQFHDDAFDYASVTGGAHYSATDLVALAPGDADLCGTLPADRAAAVTRGVVADWLDRHVRGLDTPRRSWPEIVWHS